MKKLSLVDKVLIELEHSLRTSHVKPIVNDSRPYPGNESKHPELDEDEKKLVAGLMRVNNAGEVAAQGLYRGQAASAKDQHIQQDMLLAANEENEHLNWCQTRLEELGSRRSLLDPFWYWASFVLGFTAGSAGNKWSLGFVEETEIQVGRHLDNHLQKLPQQDERSRQILQQMKIDELKHASNAHAAGAAPLPGLIKKTMAAISRVMTISAFRI